MRDVDTASVAKRRYHSPLRQAQAVATRERILDAALDLFSTNGYATTSVAAIAARAGVAPETIYASFGTKRGLVDGLVARLDADAAFEAARARARDLGWSPGALMIAMAETATSFWIVNARIMSILRDAIGDPDIGDEWLRRHELRRELLARAIHSLPDGALRAGLDPDMATDVVWGLTSDELFRMMVRVRGWTPERFVIWLRDELARAILADPALPEPLPAPVLPEGSV